MNRLLPFIIFLFLISCGNEKVERPTTAMDTGRDFIRASLNGDFNPARELIWPDEQNNQLFDSYVQYFEKLPAERKRNYKTASYEINKYLDLNDSVTIINYSNSYMKRPMEIKLIRMQGQWWVDFKYTYSGNLPID